MIKKFKSGIILSCLALSLAGCGGKEQYTVDEYANSNSEEAVVASGTSSEGSESSNTESPDSESAAPEGTTAAAVSEGKLSQKLGGTTYEWGTSFTASGVNVNLNAHSEIKDTDSLPVYKVSLLKESDLNEDEVVKNIFGDSAKKIDRQLDYSNGDSEELVSDVNTLYYQYHRDKIESLSYEEQAAITTSEGWCEEEGFTIHTYEGTYQGIEYELFIGYDRQDNTRMISLYPKNIGEYFGNEKLDTIASFWVGTDLQEQPNVKEFLGSDMLSEKDVDDRVAEAESILVDKFGMNMPDGFISNDKGDSGYDREYTFYISRQALKDAGYDNVYQIENVYTLMDTFNMMDPDSYLMDGFNAVAYPSLGGQDIFVDPRGGVIVNIFDGGNFYLTDKGVLGFSFASGFEYEEQMSEDVPVLDYESMLHAFESDLTASLDASELSKSSITFSEARFVYYPIPSPDVQGELTLVPAWEFSSMDYDTFVLINAMDGSLIEIMY